MRLNRFAVIFIILLASSLMLTMPVFAQDEEAPEYPAEINARIIGDIPPIQVSKWTQIDIEISDAFGIDYGMLSETIPRWVMEIIWPLNPSFPQPVKRYLGPLSIELDPEIIRGSSEGWEVRMDSDSSVIAETISGDVHNITLEVLVDDSSIANSVIVGIKCTRKDTFGEPIGYSYVYVPVKASPTNYIKMESLADSTKEAAPKTLVDFTLDIKNEGYYKDVFEFEIEEENGLMGLMNQQAVTMMPGETKRVILEILTPEKLFDPGTPNEIRVYVKSTGNTTKTLVGTLIVVTRGIYISPLVGIIAAPIIAFIAIGYVGFFWYNDKRNRELLGKPNKPWKIPIEKENLERLKEKDSEEYQKVMDMMKQEYESALLWWKSTSQEKKGDRFNFSNILPQFKKEKDEKSKPTESKEENLKDKSVKKKTKKKSENSKKKKEEKTEQSSEDRSEPKKTNYSSSQKNQGSEDVNKESSEKQSPLISDKIVSGLKKWFTVPEEEKQKESSEKMHATKSVEKKPKEKTEKQSQQPSEQKQEESKTDYEQELDRIEKEQKRLRTQKEKQREQSQKQKAIEKIKKAEKKQKKKWSL